MQVIAFLKKLPLTFYSIPFYKALVKDGKGIGLSFLFVAALLAFAQSVMVMSDTFGPVWSAREAIFEALPEVTVRGGELSIKGQDPLALTFLENEEGGPLRFVFDTAMDSSNINALTKRMDDEKIFVLATKDKVLVYDKSVGKAEITDVTTLHDSIITHEDWGKAGRLFSYSILPAVAVASVLLLWVTQLGSAFFGGLLIFVMAPLFKVKPFFSGVMRLSAAAKIPGATLLLFLPPHPLQPVMQLLIWLGFVVFGLLAARKSA